MKALRTQGSLFTAFHPNKLLFTDPEGGRSTQALLGPSLLAHPPINPHYPLLPRGGVSIFGPKSEKLCLRTQATPPVVLP